MPEISLKTGDVDANGDSCGPNGSSTCYVVAVGNTGDSTSGASLTFAAPTLAVKKSDAVLGNYLDTLKIAGMPTGDTIVAEQCDSGVNGPQSAADHCDAATESIGTAAANGKVTLTPTGITTRVGGAFSDASGGTCDAGNTCQLVITDLENGLIELSDPVSFAAPVVTLKKSTNISPNYVDKVAAANFPIGDSVVALECDTSVTAANVMTRCDAATSISGTVGTSGKVTFNAAGVAVETGVEYTESGSGTCATTGTCEIAIYDTGPGAVFAAAPIEVSPNGEATLPGAPTIGQATAGQGTATVAFLPASSGGLAISSYSVTATDVSDPGNGGQVVSGSASPIIVTGLTDGDSYTFAVTATNALGTGPPSASSTPVTPEATVPTAPLEVQATGGDSSATVTFASATDNGSPITGYTVTATDLTSPSNGGQTADGSGSPIVVPGLTGGDSYSFSVTATNAVGTGPFSVASNDVIPVAPPTAPQPVSAVAIGGGDQATVSFGSPASNGGSPITGYTVTATDLTTPSNGGQTADGSDSPILVPGLTAGDSYRIRRRRVQRGRRRPFFCQHEFGGPRILPRTLEFGLPSGRHSALACWCE